MTIGEEKMRPYILLGILLAFVASTALAQFGDILKETVKGKVEESTGLSTWQFKACTLTAADSERVPAAANVTKYITYNHTQGDWTIHTKCQDGMYQLKAMSYGDAKDVSNLVKNGTLKAGYNKGSFSGFFLSQ